METIENFNKLKSNKNKANSLLFHVPERKKNDVLNEFKPVLTNRKRNESGLKPV